MFRHFFEVSMVATDTAGWHWVRHASDPVGKWRGPYRSLLWANFLALFT